MVQQPFNDYQPMHFEFLDEDIMALLSGRKQRSKESSRSKIERKQKKKKKFPVKDRKKTKEKRESPIKDRKKMKELYKRVFGPDKYPNNTE